MDRLVFGEPFSGMPGAVLGGYLAGLLARELGPCAAVTLRAGLPFGEPCWREAGAPAGLVRASGKTIAEGVACEALGLEPPLVTLTEAERGSLASSGPEMSASSSVARGPSGLGRRGGWTAPRGGARPHQL